MIPKKARPRRHDSWREKGFPAPAKPRFGHRPGGVLPAQKGHYAFVEMV
jgi:hypothetical protein